jgi:serine/threonine protein kinase/tetratricopeptide (TPR) repeat protein
MTRKIIAGHYEVDISDNHSNLLGQGGMGTVYIGKDTDTHELVAIKQLKDDVIMQDPEIVRRFELEGDALRRLNHPNIVKMLATEDRNGSHFLVMEYVEGGSLLDTLNEEDELSIQRILYIALDLADALTRAHRLKILHRDIKPANVLIAKDGTPRLTDFGMARVQDVHVTQTGMIVGTLSYLSPEALHGETIDERSDIWAFGVLLFEMLTGQRPFPETNPGPLITSIMTKPVPDLEALRPDAPTALVDLVYRMLAKDVHARIPSVRLIGAELESLIRGDTSSIQSVAPPDTDGRFVTPTPTTTSSQVRQSQIIPTHNLPQSPTAFVGREADLSELSTLIDDESIHLITMIGPGGIGKTRIALEVAHRHLKTFSDGVYYVPLAPLKSDEHIVATIADNINFTFGGADDPTKELLNYLAEKHMLLVMDNFEHLIQGANLLSDILKSAPNVTIIATSRERLRLRGEHIFEVEGMILPRSNSTADHLQTYPAAELFLQSAHRVMPNFEIDDDNVEDVTRVIRLVQGFPLGIELAAAWLEMLPIEEIVQEIENSFDFLETDLRDVPERHRSIRAVFEYSWNLMTPDEQAIFLELSVFQGGFEREAAQQVTGASLRNLTALVNKSLLIRMPSGRYQAHKLLQQYAIERWDDEQAQMSVAGKHAHYYGQYMKKIEPLYNSSKEQTAVEAMEVELENLRAAWDLAVENQLWVELDASIHTMLLFFQARSMLTDGITLFRELGDRLEKNKLTDNPCYHRARLRQAMLMSRQGNYEAVYNMAETAYQYFLKQNNAEEICYGLNNMSYAKMMLGLYDEARDLAQQSLDYAGDPNDGHVATWFFSMGNLGYAEFLRGNLEEAKRIYEEINTLTSNLDYSPIGIAFGLNNLGEVERNLGNMEGAQTLFDEAYTIFKQYKNRRGMAFSLNNLGGVMYLIGNVVGAQEKFFKAYELHREVGDLTGTAHSLSALGNGASFERNFEEGRRYYETALQIRREVGNLRGIADSLTDLARVEMDSYNIDTGRAYIDEALDIRVRIGDKQGLSYAKAIKSLMYLYLEEYDAAEKEIKEALALARETNNMMALSQSLIGMGMIHIKNNQLDDARKALVEALALGQQQGLLMLILMGLTIYSFWLKASGDLETSLALVTQVLLYPSSYHIRMTEDKANMLSQMLIKELDGETVRQAEDRGRAMILDDVIADIIAG